MISSDMFSIIIDQHRDEYRLRDGNGCRPRFEPRTFRLRRGDTIITTALAQARTTRKTYV